MNPAFSVIFFTSLSGAGYGLLFWSALAALRDWMRSGPLLLTVVLGLLLVTTGLLSSLGHLGKPQRAWRAFSQWRTSWLSREGVMALATYVPALVLLAVLAGNALAAHGGARVLHGSALGIASCLLLLVFAPLTVYCTAMIYASLPPVPAWRHAAVVPVYGLFALLTGGLLAAADAALAGTGIDNRVAIAAVATAIALALVKARYWRDIDHAPLPATRGDAVGLPGRAVSVFERPHTQDNYLTREMGYVLARKHARPLRVIALLLLAAVPMVAAWLAWTHPDWAGPVFTLGALLALSGVLVERWLFFAQARHLVTLYY